MLLKSRITSIVPKAICIMLAFVFLCPINIFAASAKFEFDKEVDTLLTYLTMSEDNILTFDEEAAVANNEPHNIIEAGQMAVEFSIVYAQAEKGIMTYDGMPIYGNYCGPGHSGDSGTLLPVDYLDRLCKTHDECYASDGYFNCKCDKALLNGIYAKLNNMTGSEHTAALAIMAFFELKTLFC